MFLFVALLGLAACGSSSSSSGAEEAPVAPAEPPIGPDLNGEDWHGDFRTLDGTVTPITATITHEANRITITTDLPVTGSISRFEGTISPGGQMFMFDLFDGEDWTTLFGPASRKSINLADFVFVEGQNVQTNIIILKR